MAVRNLKFHLIKLYQVDVLFTGEAKFTKELQVNLHKGAKKC